MQLRLAEPERDAAPCAAIYAPYVRQSAVSFEEDPPSPAEMAARMERLLASYPWLVAEHDGALAGFAYAGPHRDRAAYRWAVDVTVYVAPAHQRLGVGRALYRELFGALGAQGFRTACAGIALPNPASVALHEACGFELVGVYRNIGWKAGAWRDVAWWQRALDPAGDAGDGAPPPPQPQPRLR